MKDSTKERKKVFKQIAKVFAQHPGIQAQIARRIRRRGGKSGVSRSLITEVLACRKSSKRVESAIIREAVRLTKKSALLAAIDFELAAGGILKPI